MNLFLWIALLIGIAGIAVAAIVCVSSRRSYPAEGRRVLSRRPARGVIALTAAGPARVVDAAVVDLIQRGAVRAEGGRLTVIADPAEMPFQDRELLEAIQRVGADGISAVRAEYARYIRSELSEALRLRLIVNPTRVEFEPMIVWLPTMLFGFGFAMVGVINHVSYEATVPEWVPPIILGFAMAVAPFIALGVWCLQPGYFGKNPSSQLGRDTVAVFLAERLEGASQADRIAAGGFATITDPALLTDVFPGVEDARWDARRWRRSNYTQKSDIWYSPSPSM